MTRPAAKTLILALLFLVLLHASALNSIFPVSGVTWSALRRLTSTDDFDYNPHAMQTSDGKVWLFWQTAVNQVPGPPPIPDIQYKTWDWSSWPANGDLSQGGSLVQPVVASTGQDILPTTAESNNGTLFLSFSSDRTGNFDIYLKRYNPSTGWSTEEAITSDGGREETSSLVATPDGTLWVFWDRLNLTNGNQNIYYKKYSPGSGWSAESALTTSSSPVRNRQPSAFLMRDGRIWVVWSQVQDLSFSKIYVYYRVYDRGWLSATPLTTTGPDRHPAIVQGADLTIWVFWSREMSLPGNCFQEDLFYRTSTNNGSTFSADLRIMDDTGLSNCNDNITPDDIDVVPVPLRDFKIWVFWASDRDPQNWWDLYYTSTNAFPIHDVAVNSIVSDPHQLRRGGLVAINVTVTNQGAYTETFTVTVQAANVSVVTIGSQTITLTTWQSAKLLFTWNTGNINPARYRISASIPAVPGESTGDQANNSSQNGITHVLPPGDVNYDGTVNIQDAALLAYSYGTRPGDPLWNPDADLDGNGRIDIIDAATLAFWFGASG